MLYFLLTKFYHYPSLSNLVKYITFRSGCAMMTALIVSFIFGQRTINYLKARQNGGQPIREDGPASHIINKSGTPTMGGLLIIMSIFFSCILWADLSNKNVLVVMFITLAYAILGFVDDYLKIKKRNNYSGVKAKGKLMVQFIVALIGVVYLNYTTDAHLQHKLALPFFKDFLLDLGYFYIIFAIIVVVGASNAVNLTDGLDGLVIVPIALAAISFAIISYVVGNSIFANYLQLHYVVGAGELSVFCASIVGASLGFLWFNAPPAKVFMGDTGSLALGGAIGSISVITKHEIVLGVIGGLFVMEAMSVILQVYYFKFTKGKRLFKMAPIHHHFEKLGWSEPTIVIRFWIIAVVFALVGLSTLKLR
jgi:phospho-N-acetylmuramoyl-pentapeptide-transferase